MERRSRHVEGEVSLHERSHAVYLTGYRVSAYDTRIPTVRREGMLLLGTRGRHVQRLTNK